MERARIVLACLEGKEIQQVARELGLSIPTVTKWRKRFALWGLRGLRDQRRPGKPAIYDTAFRGRVLALLEQPPPSGMSHWDGPAVAEKLGSSVYAVSDHLKTEFSEHRAGPATSSAPKARSSSDCHRNMARSIV